MQLWLTDPNNIEKLLAMKKLQDESKKRKRTYDDSFSGMSSPSDISDLYSNPGMVTSSLAILLAIFIYLSLFILGQPGSPENNDSKKSRESGSAGLDLSFKRDDDENDSDNDKDETMNDEEERNEDSDDGVKSTANGNGVSSARSRRKPAAPQWVNPVWSGDQETEPDTKHDNDTENDRTINGVCVVNSGLV